MATELSSIWRVPAYLPYLQPVLTDFVVQQAEEKIGYRLPSELLSLLEQQNGGYIRYSLPDIPHDRISGIGPEFPSLIQVDWENDREYVSFQLDGLVPFDGDGHWHLCLDYRQDVHQPAVTYADVECDSESRIADSFADYLTLLKLDISEGDYVILGVSDLEEVKSRITKVMQLRFDPPSSWEQGYPIHRAGEPGHDKPDWIWISANVVPRGFVRETDPRYQELRGLMQGDGRQYPELPECCFLLTATEGLVDRTVNVLRDSGIEIQRLQDAIARRSHP